MKKTALILSLLVIVLTSCNFPVPQGSGLTVEQQAATVVAQTLTAVGQDNTVPATSPTKGGAEQPQATPTASGETPTIQPNLTSTALTGTPAATVLTVDSNTNCREGPGLSYAILIVLVPGTTYQMIARTADNKYWVVTEIGKSTPCWVPAEMSNAYGNVNQLSVTTPAAPTSAANPLQPPTGLAYQYECVYNGVNSDITVNLKWSDRSNNETGFRVYRDGVLVVDLPANTTLYVNLFTGSATVVYSYRVAAYNSVGEAMGGLISFSCQ
jgi:hypothetical protein